MWGVWRVHVFSIGAEGGCCKKYVGSKALVLQDLKPLSMF